MTINIFGIKFNIRKYELAVVIVLLAVVLGFIGYKIQHSNKGIIINTDEEKVSEIVVKSDDSEVDGEEKENDKVEDIQVYVVGCVKNPGVVTLKKGQIIDDAIKAAGGATEEADLENINLVYRLNSNVMLKICSKSENKDLAAGGEAGAGVVITKDSGGVVAGSAAKDKKINLNTATLDELKTLPGIGESTAKDIIIYREKTGGFENIQDIMKVNGIKEGRFNAIKELITVE